MPKSKKIKKYKTYELYGSRVIYCEAYTLAEAKKKFKNKGVLSKVKLA